MRSAVCASLAAVAVATVPPPNKKMLFDHFVAKYNRVYATEVEKEARFRTFSDNVDQIYSSNYQNKTYKLGITENTDLSFEEWRSKYIKGFDERLKDGKSERATFVAPAGFVEPASVDWVAKGGVTSVKDQGQCGSCWAFSTVGALEGAMHVSGRTMVDLSMQHLLACDHTDSGCGGGLMDNAFKFVESSGITSLEEEPYQCKNPSAAGCRDLVCGGCTKSTGSHCFFSDCKVGVCTGVIDKVCQCPDNQCFADGKCAAESPLPLVLKPGDVTGFTDVQQTEQALEAAVAQQPVSVAIEADQFVFQHYTSGVLTSDACGEQLDHGVLAVGYGEDKGVKYWKVKNSWGVSFGEEGYIRIERGDPASGGECGIRKSASFPTIKAADSIVV